MTRQSSRKENLMCKHAIFLTNDFVIHKQFIALHVVYADDTNAELPKAILNKLTLLLGAGTDFSVQCLITKDKSWQSVVDYDPYFEHMYPIEYTGDDSLKEYTDIIKANKILTPQDVAKFVLSRVQCTQLKLQKLVYFCYADYLVRTGKPVFAEQTLAYDYGPVYATLRKEYGEYKDKVIESDTSQRRKNIILSRYFAADNSLDIHASFNGTLNRYGDCTASELVELTHSPNSPWSITKEQGKQEISVEDILKYHKYETKENRTSIN
jgi:uncharacterized phage-associated protein